MKKIIALPLTVLIFLLSILCIYAVEIETPGTCVPDDSAQTNAVAWAKSQIGVGLDYDGYEGNQCVDLIFYYYTFLGVGSYGGNASAYIWNSLPSGWQRITYTSGFVPQPGDIAVWKVNHYCNYCSTNENGHIGIITSANASTMTVVNQNYNWQSYCSSNSFPTNVLQCVIRPSFSSMSSKVSVSFSTFTDKQSIGTTNAVLATKATLTGAVNSSISKCGLILYNYDGNKLATITENTLGSPNFSGETVAFAWYDLNSDGNYTLAPDTTYKYKFFVEILGTTHYSNTLSFKTSGTHSHAFSGNTCTTCGYTKDPCATGHSHKTTWSKDGSKHWHACSVCGEPEEKLDHDFDHACDTTCNTCGYTRTISHSYKTVWDNNSTQHWHSCSVCGIAGTKMNHVYDNACDTVCNTCGYTRTITHSYKTIWEKDGTQHWHVCSVCGVSGTKSGHAYDNACDTTCNTCGYTRTITHSYKKTWETDRGGHWHECSVCGASDEKKSHAPGTAATETTAQTCTACGYVIQAALGHTHQYETEWTTNASNHWRACIGCGDRKDEGNHAYDHDKDATCNVCGHTRIIVTVPDTSVESSELVPDETPDTEESLPATDSETVTEPAVTDPDSGETTTPETEGQATTTEKSDGDGKGALVALLSAIGGVAVSAGVVTLIVYKNKKKGRAA